MGFCVLLWICYVLAIINMYFLWYCICDNLKSFRVEWRNKGLGNFKGKHRKTMVLGNLWSYLMRLKNTYKYFRFVWFFLWIEEIDKHFGLFVFVMKIYCHLNESYNWEMHIDVLFIALLWKLQIMCLLVFVMTIFSGLLKL